MLSVAVATSRSPPAWRRAVAFVCFVSLLCLPCGTRAQTKTDPAEVEALNTMFGRWGRSAPSTWNISGDPCSGAATDDSISFTNNDYNPLIKCECSADNGTTCHITQLKVYALDVTGPVPEELQSFPQLFDLNMGQNYLTGSLPAFLGNLSKMEYMNFGLNALSGPIPKEIGNLTNLISLGIGSNDFNGSLPSEFGKLTSLQELYIVSSGVSGEIPSTFSNLQTLKKLWTSGTNFTGSIPDFIGDLTNLTDLRLQGNSFQGPIPSNFRKLTKLSTLKIGDLTSGSSSLDFIENMTSLSTLILRNCNISDVIPSNFESYINLKLLDLSFNNLTGQIPQSLFNLEDLTFLFLGNNSLSGSLPTGKASSIVNIDLSYNNLSGTFPSWVRNENLNLNLVANNFFLDESNNSILSPGLECLQKDIPCNRGSPIWSSFGVNCASSRSITASDGTLYESDDETVTAASYYVSTNERWAMSNVGRFGDSPNFTYVQSSSSQFTNTLDSELFQRARISPSSLRYYGLGLENGNYSVKLQFAETAFPNGQTWKSVGKRIFDIYIQGNLVAKDFDIRKNAGGISLRAISRNYFVNVTDNFLEIHFFWAGKGTCCIPTQGTYGPLISAISISPNFMPTVSNQLPSSEKSNNARVIGLVVGISTVCVLVLLAILIWRKRKTGPKMNNNEELLGLVIKSDIFTYEELRISTGDFSLDNKLGEGGFGTVFKGVLSDGRLVGVKKLSTASHQGKQQFIAEIETISKVQHRNLVKMYGCCYEDDKRLLVYEYLENKSLDLALFGKADLNLDWPSRLTICLGTARGLAYLHEDSSPRIVHRDVKASNILLDADLNPKISDFGLAKLYDDTKTHISTRIAGTIGYLAPEYALRGRLTVKADVFGFGVVALEIVAGRPNTDLSVDPEKMYLLEWAWDLYENNTELELMDPTLSSYNKLEAGRVIGVALLCTQTSPSMRPSMSQVVSMLAGDIEVRKATSKPSYFEACWHGAMSSGIITNPSGILEGDSAGEGESDLPFQGI